MRRTIGGRTIEEWAKKLQDGKAFELFDPTVQRLLLCAFVTGPPQQCESAKTMGPGTLNVLCCVKPWGHEDREPWGHEDREHENGEIKWL